MSSGAQSFYSSPGFELFRRGLNAQSIKQFRGMNAFQAHTLLDPEWALDCLNVMVPGWGGISKFRLPVAISGVLAPDPVNGPYQFVDFQQGNGTRQVVASFPDNSLWYFTWNAAGTALNPGVLIEAGASDAPPWSMVEANNILFMANGIRMMKWTGTAFQKWGISPPTSTMVGTVINGNVTTLTRAANVVTFNANAHVLAVGDTVIVTRAVDPTFNGQFKLTAAGLNPTYAQVAANAVTTANVTAPLGDLFSAVPITAISRSAGLVTVSVGAGTGPSSPTGTGVTITVAGVADATFNGTFTLSGSGGNTYFYNQTNLPDAALGAGGTISGGATMATGRSYAFAYQNPVTGHSSNIGPPATVGPVTNRILQVWTNLSADAQVPATTAGYQLYATLDGGGDLFSDPNETIANQNIGPDGILDFFVLDAMADVGLDKTKQGPLINNVPPVGKYLAVGQSRIFIGNLAGAPNQIAYTGYEQILIGRPEETVPPSNRLLLQIGAEAVNGLGVLQMGVVAHSATKRMYMLRGNVEDIVLIAPVAFSAFLEELPWNVGTMCHDSEQSTPFGLIFWATDRTVQLFDGSSTLSDMSSTVYPILRRATPGQESKAKSCYFNWLERDWYGLTFAIDGSLTNNYTIFWALQKDGTIDVFPCNIPMDSMSVLSTPKLQRILAIGSLGLVYNLPVSQDTRGGISDLTVVPATAGNLSAFWRSGYFGNESPQRSKMFKRGIVVTDQQGFQVTKYLVDNVTKTIAAPLAIGPSPVNGSGFSIGQRATRCSILINFPQQDVAANLLELTVGAIATSDRL